MTAPASVKQELHELIETLDSDQAIRVLAMIGLMTDDGELTPEEEDEILQGIASIEAGEFVTQAEIERELGFRESDPAIRVLAMIGLMTDDGELAPEEEASILRSRAEFAAGSTIKGADLERELGFRR